MAGRILTLQRQARELGRLRTGYTDGSGSKPRPVRSETWIVTSHSQDYVEAAAAEWGGTPEKWQPMGNGSAQWRVITSAVAIDAILPPGDPLSQSFEMWNRGGCARRCDGVTELLSDSPCLCIAQYGEDFHEQKPGEVCSMTTRLNLMLPAMPDIGVWRAETHSYYAANELAGHVDTIRGLVGPTAMIPVRLRIEQRSRVAGGKTKHFPVIALELRGVTAGQVLEGRGAITAALGSTQPIAQIESAVDLTPWRERIRDAGSRDALTAAWNDAVAAGVAEALKADFAARGAEFTDRAEVAAEVVEEDPDELWLQIVAKAGDFGWSTDQVENDFAAKSGGVHPGSADATQMRAYLDLIKTQGRPA